MHHKPLPSLLGRHQLFGWQLAEPPLASPQPHVNNDNMLLFGKNKPEWLNDVQRGSIYLCLYISEHLLFCPIILRGKKAAYYWCFWTVVLEKTLESPLDSKEIQPVHPKRNQSWVFIGRTDVEAETPRLWPPDAKNWLICKDPDAGKDWRQEEKETTEDEMVGWHHQRDGREVKWGSEVAQPCLTLCDPVDCNLPGSSLHGFFRQEYWSGLPFPFFPTQGSNRGLPHSRQTL